MKFRWVPWYKTTFEIDVKCIDFLQRVRKAVDHDDWKKSGSRYLGYVYNNRFDIFFRYNFFSGQRYPLEKLPVPINDLENVSIENP